MTTHAALVRALFQTKALAINTQQPFVLTSGKTSPMYLDHRRLFSFPDVRKLLVEAWAQEIGPDIRKKMDLSALAFAGAATAGIAPAYALAEHFKCGFAYVRSKAKEHGLGRTVEGHLDPQARVVAVDDMVTTGGSLLTAIENLKKEGAKVALATSITRYPNPKVDEAFEAAGTPLVTLFTVPDLLDTAWKLDIIGSKEMRAVMDHIARKE